MQAHELLPAVHRVAALAKRWLLGTHQGAVKPAHLQAYLDELTFRFNRRHSRSRGMLFYRLLEQSVQSEPRTYRSLVADSGAGTRRPQPRRRAASESAPPAWMANRSTAPGATDPTPPAQRHNHCTEMEDPFTQMKPETLTTLLIAEGMLRARRRCCR